MELVSYTTFKDGILLCIELTIFFGGGGGEGDSN